MLNEKVNNRTDSLDRCEIARPELNSVWREVREEGRKLPKPYKVEVEVLPSGEVRKSWNSAHAAGGFRQVHDEQNLKLQTWVAKQIAPGRELWDLFGGSGNLSLGIASSMSHVHCVDVGTPLKRPEGLPENYQFHRSPVLPWLQKQRQNPDIRKDRPISAIIDPPREGLDKTLAPMIDALDDLGVSELVAVGCDPDSWARDVARFARRGWRLERAAVFDLFPQTPHVESACLLLKERS